MSRSMIVSGSTRAYRLRSWRAWQLREMRGLRPYVAIHRRSFQSSLLRHPRC